MTEQFNTLSDTINEICSYLGNFPNMSAFIVMKEGHPNIYYPTYLLLPGLHSTDKAIDNKIKQTDGKLVAQFAIIR